MNSPKPITVATGMECADRSGLGHVYIGEPGEGMGQSHWSCIAGGAGAHGDGRRVPKERHKKRKYVLGRQKQITCCLLQENIKALTGYSNFPHPVTVSHTCHQTVLHLLENKSCPFLPIHVGININSYCRVTVSFLRAHVCC